MFVCLECGHLFSEPEYWSESRGECFGFPAYEEWSGCPVCRGSYIEAFKCDCCDEYITDDYFVVDDQRYCKDCCREQTLGEE